MYTTIFTAAIAVIAALFIVVGVFKGKKHVWIYSALKLASVIISAVAALCLSTVIARSAIEWALNYLVDSGKIDSLGGFALGQILGDMPVAAEALSALVAMIISPFLFLALFFLLKKIFYFVSKLSARSLIKIPKLAPVRDEEAYAKLSKKKQKKQALRTKGSNPIGMLLGGACGLVIAFAVLVPVLGTIGVANDVITTADAFIDGDTMDLVAEIADAADENYATNAIRTLGAGAVYDQMTTYKVGVGNATLTKEVNFATATVKAVYAVKSPDLPRAQAAESVKAAGAAFADSTIVPELASEFLAAASECWDDGRDFHGIKKPSVQSMDEIIDPLFEIFEESDAVNIRTDVATLADIVAKVVERDAAGKLKSNIVAIFDDEELSYVIIYDLLDNERLAPMVGKITEFGFKKLGSSLNADFEALEFDSSDVADIDAEAHELSKVLLSVAELMDKVNTQGLDTYALAKEFGPLLDNLDNTEVVGHNNTTIILKQMFISETLYSQIGMTRDEAGDVADSINEKSVVKGYTPLIVSVIETAEVLRMSTDGNSNQAEMVEKIEQMLYDLTPESSQLLQEMTSPSVIASKGAPERSAKPMSDMFSDMFQGLSDAKESGMSDEQYNAEAKAMSDMMNVAMNFNSSKTSGMFGEGSATGVEADEFVDNIFGSTVISATVVDTVYKEGEEPENDPLKFQKSLGTNDKNKLVTALNDKWANATEEEKADEEYKKNYVALGALMNVELSFTADGIVG